MKMTDDVFRIKDTDLASRSSAAKLRSLVEQTAVQEGTASIDLKVVRSVSDAYADELFGVLVARHGLEWFAEHVRLQGATPAVLSSIAGAVKSRLEESSGSPELALLAARKALEAREGRSD